MKNKLVLLGSILLSTISFAQDEQLVIEKTKEIKSSEAIIVHVSPIIIEGYSSAITFGSGLSVKALDLGNKFSVSGDLNYFWGPITLDKVEPTFITKNINKSKPMLMNFNLGYTVSSNKKEQFQDVNWSNSKYSLVPIDVITSYVANIGFLRQSQFSTHQNFELRDGVTGGFKSGTTTVFHNINNLTIGFARVKSMNTKFVTSKFGSGSSNKVKSLNLDLLVMLPSKFGVIYYKEIDPNTYEFTGNQYELNLNDQNIYRAQFKKMPIGIKFSYTQFVNKFKKSNMNIGYQIELGMRTGYFKEFGNLFYGSMKLSFGFGKFLK